MMAADRNEPFTMYGCYFNLQEISPGGVEFYHFFACMLWEMASIKFEFLKLFF